MSTLPKARYYVSYHPHWDSDRASAKAVVETIGPANAARDVLPSYSFRLIGGQETTDSYRGTRWSHNGDTVFVYEVRPETPLGPVVLVAGHHDVIVSEYGIRGAGKARTGFDRPVDHQPRRVLPPDAAAEIERLSNEVERLRRRIAGLVAQVDRLDEDKQRLMKKIRNASDALRVLP